MSSRRSKRQRRQGHPARASRTTAPSREQASGRKATVRSRGLRPIGRVGAKQPRQVQSGQFYERFGRWITSLLSRRPARSPGAGQPRSPGAGPPRSRATAPGQGGAAAPAAPPSTAAPRVAAGRRAALARPRVRFATRPEAALLELTRIDLAWAAVTAVLSAGIFATALTSHPGLGDAPESVAGVSSVGILHAPGYPAYVLAAHLFTLLVPAGDEALRVNLFSLICGSLAIGGAQLLARRVGAARWAASVGALSIALTAGFWFYAVFAKHDAFSALLFLIALHLALSWRARPRTSTLVALGAVCGIGFGSSWPLMILLAPTIVLVLVVGRRRLSLRSLAAATAIGLVLVVALYGFVMIRAAQNPAVDWGQATTVSRLVNLIERTDFTPQFTPPSRRTASTPQPRRLSPSTASAGNRQPVVVAAVSSGSLSRGANAVKNYFVIFGHEFGVLALVLAAAGLLLSLTLRRSYATYPLLLAFMANFIGALVEVGPSRSGIDVTLLEGGFLFGCYFVLGCWAALAIGEAAAVVAGAIARVRPRMRSLWLRRGAFAGVASLLAVGALVPPALAHSSQVRVEIPSFADRYSQSMFAELPRGAAVLIWGAEFTQPLIYRQVVYHQRRDLAVIAADGLAFQWYRQQVAHRLGVRLPALVGDSVSDAYSVIRTLARVRPVYLDPQTSEHVKALVRVRPVGLLAQVVGSSRAAAISSPSAIDHAVRQAERTAGLPDPRWQHWPNDGLLSSTYSTAELRVARYYAQAHNLAGLRSALTNVLEIEPTNVVAASDMAILNRQSGAP